MPQPTQRKHFEIRGQGTGNAEVLIYGDIGGWDEESVHASQLVAELGELEAETIDVRINSFGGAVSDGLAIYNALVRHSARVVSHVDGVAASMASVIAMAGEEVRAAEASLMMVHAPWGLGIGNAQELRDLADTLDTFSDAMATAYAQRVGLVQAREWLRGREDVWFTAAEASEIGLVDTVIEANVEEDAELAAALWRRYGAESAPLKMAAWVRAHRPHSEVSIVPSKKADDTKKAPAASASDHQQQQQAAAAAAAAAAPSDPAPPAGATVTQLDAARAEGEQAILDRNREIAALARPHLRVEGMGELVEELQGTAGMTLDTARARILAKLGEGAEPAGGPDAMIRVGVDAVDKVRAGVLLAIQGRANIVPVDRTNEFAGYTLLECCRAMLHAHNVTPRGGWDKTSVVGAGFTHTSGDFPNLLADVANKELLRGWEESGETYPLWTRPGNLPDFKPSRRVDLNLFPTLDEIPEGAEYKYGTIGDRGEHIQLATYGKIIGITRQAIINDDLDAFTRIPFKAGRAASRTIGNLVYAIINGNPLMSDGFALFSAEHKNLGTAGIIETASVDELRNLMAVQEDPDGHASGGLNIVPQYMLTPSALRGKGMVVVESEVEVAGAPSTQRRATVPNSVRGIATVIADARLDKASVTAWYLVADGNQHDTIEVAYLDGVQTPFLDEMAGWTVDGVQWKARIDAGVKALDFRTMAKNAGA